MLEQLHAATTPSAATAPIARVRALREISRGRSERGATEEPYNNRLDVAIASICGDTDNPRTLRGFRRVAQAAARRSRYVGTYWGYSTLPCLAWPVPAQDRYTGPWSARTSGPVLFLTSRFDPATARQSAVAMNRRLPRSRLLTVNGWAPTALQTRSACADGAVERYLVRLTLPRPGATCETGVVPFVDSPDAQRRLLPDGIVPGPPL